MASGPISRAKGVARHKEASQAYEEGRTFFVCRINLGILHHGLSGSLPSFAEQLEGIESAGWYLTHSSFTQDTKNRPEGYFVFRRIQPQAAPQQQYPPR